MIYLLHDTTILRSCCGLYCDCRNNVIIDDSVDGNQQLGALNSQQSTVQRSYKLIQVDGGDSRNARHYGRGIDCIDAGRKVIK